jgi:hypothetical protein
MHPGEAVSVASHRAAGLAYFALLQLTAEAAGGFTSDLFRSLDGGSEVCEDTPQLVRLSRRKFYSGRQNLWLTKTRP